MSERDRNDLNEEYYEEDDIDAWNDWDNYEHHDEDGNIIPDLWEDAEDR